MHSRPPLAELLSSNLDLLLLDLLFLVFLAQPLELFLLEFLLKSAIIHVEFAAILELQLFLCLLFDIDQLSPLEGIRDVVILPKHHFPLSLAYLIPLFSALQLTLQLGDFLLLQLGNKVVAFHSEVLIVVTCEVLKSRVDRLTFGGFEQRFEFMAIMLMDINLYSLILLLLLLLNGLSFRLSLLVFGQFGCLQGGSRGQGDLFESVPLFQDQLIRNSLQFLLDLGKQQITLLISSSINCSLGMGTSDDYRWSYEDSSYKLLSSYYELYC